VQSTDKRLVRDVLLRVTVNQPDFLACDFPQHFRRPFFGAVQAGFQKGDFMQTTIDSVRFYWW
jgi:hypothetical protein